MEQGQNPEHLPKHARNAGAGGRLSIHPIAANTVSDTGMDQLAIQQFNAQFTQYDSNTVSGGSARALYDTVVNNNNTDTEKRFVSLNLVRCV